MHDHTVWGAVGVLRGVERSQRFPLSDGAAPRAGDVHQVSDALPDHVTISIHVYGADIGAVARHIYRRP